MRTLRRPTAIDSIKLRRGERGEIAMSDSGISRRDLVRRGGFAAAAGASLFGLAGCARREEFAQGGADVGETTTGAATTGLQTRGQIRIEMPTHMEPQD